MYFGNNVMNDIVKGVIQDIARLEPSDLIAISRIKCRIDKRWEVIVALREPTNFAIVPAGRGREPPPVVSGDSGPAISNPPIATISVSEYVFSAGS